MHKMRIALLSGGKSSERDVSLNSGNQVFEALDKEKYDVQRYDPQTDIARLVSDAPDIDFALIILHGPYGEDGTVQGLLELLDIPYQGAGVLGSAMAMNKLVAKQLYKKAGLPIPDYAVVRENDRPADPSVLIRRIGLPLVVKPVFCGSSIGMTILKDEQDFNDAVDNAFKYDHSVLVEEYISGIELTGGVIGNDDLQALPLIEIVPNPSHEFFDYSAKYIAGETSEICPARIDDAMTETAQNYAKIAHTTLKCLGYSRTDMILRKSEIFVLETNTIPGMTPTSLFPQAAQAAGYSFSQLLDRLIALGIQAHKLRP